MVQCCLREPDGELWDLARSQRSSSDFRCRPIIDDTFIDIEGCKENCLYHGCSVAGLMKARVKCAQISELHGRVKDLG